MNLKEWQQRVHKTSRDHGWYDGVQPTTLERHMLMVSEISEATEEYRDKKEPFYIKDGKPEGEATELVDCVIRIMDHFEHKGWDLETVMKAKADYNDTRSYRHGGKLA